MTFTSSQRLPRSVNAIAVGRGISFLGDEVALLAILFRARYELGHFGVAAIMIAGALPLLLLAPFVGLLVDRVRTKPLLVVVTIAQAALCVALAWSSSELLVPLIALLACGTAIAAPAWQALIPTIVREDQLSAAMGRLQSMTAIAQVAGPFVGGVLVAYFGFHVPLLVDAVSFAVLAAVPLALRVDRRPAVGADKGFSMREAFAGVRIVFAHPVIRSLVVLAVLFVLAIGVINVVEIYFITTALHAGPRGYGLLGVCMGVGMLLVGLGAGRLAQRFGHPERLFTAGCVVLCGAILGFGFTVQLWQAAVLIFACGIGNGLVNVNAMVLITAHSTDEYRGRIFSAVNGTVSAAQITSIAIGGLLLLRFSPRPIIVVGALTSILALALTIAPVLRAGAASPAHAGDGAPQRAETSATDPAAA